MDRQQVLKRVDQAWAAIKESYAGLPDSQMTKPGVAGDWSVKDILAHVTTWERESVGPDRLQQFPLAEEAVNVLGLVVWPMVEFEADDALASAVFHHQAEPAVDQILMSSLR